VTLAGQRLRGGLGPADRNRVEVSSCKGRYDGPNSQEKKSKKAGDEFISSDGVKRRWGKIYSHLFGGAGWKNSEMREICMRTPTEYHEFFGLQKGGGWMHRREEFCHRKDGTTPDLKRGGKNNYKEDAEGPHASKTLERNYCGVGLSRHEAGLASERGLISKTTQKVHLGRRGRRLKGGDYL